MPNTYSGECKTNRKRLGNAAGFESAYVEGLSSVAYMFVLQTCFSLIRFYNLLKIIKMVCGC